MNKDIFLQMRTIIDGSHTLLDAIHLSNRFCNKYPEHKEIIMSYIYGSKYTYNVDLKTKQSLLNLAFHNQDIENTTIKDDIYDKAMLRIQNNRQKNISMKASKTITKKCPHCFHALNADENTTYVICGYINQTNGYDWYGCGKDWCFTCNKKLCKNWNDDYLQLLSNRKHNDTCCKEQATKNSLVYEEEYCGCVNMRNNSVLCLFPNYKQE